ncbi:M20 aminoacylase family protein [Roseococcus pinisoli]|uniref:Amidohydrolase n=1 Tax=Roseococcus pinisoli TaxID=2835040 RepID=A0ABS5QGC8_9PROT|nr:M20 aminoacylase family protein [Roseococcus pinisoli]MBS7812612.1 amidohydrolase [Roseococcus pinisoli]
MPVLDALIALKPEMTAWRRDFHAHPEIGFEEVRTSGIVAEKLEAWGLEVHRGIGRTGVVGVLRGRHPGNRSIGLRADMDALPMPELNDFAHRSTNPGKMHACGHDGHTAMLLGAARHLAATRDFAGTVHFIFQPAEEGLTGALAMVEDGLFHRFPCDAVYGIHNLPQLPLGVVAIRPGTVLAAVDYFAIKLRGRSSHAAEPHRGLDPLPGATQLYSALQSLVSRRMSPHSTAVLSIGQFHAGTSDIVIPEEVEMRGTIRTLTPENRKQMDELFHQMVAGTAAAHGLELELDYRRSYPPTINTPEQSDLARDAAETVVGAEGIKDDFPSLTAGEDFSYMLQSSPGGAFLLLGQAGEEGSHAIPLHNGRYDFNDELLPIGASTFAAIVGKELAAR